MTNMHSILTREAKAQYGIEGYDAKAACEKRQRQRGWHERDGDAYCHVSTGIASDRCICTELQTSNDAGKAEEREACAVICELDYNSASKIRKIRARGEDDA